MSSFALSTGLLLQRFGTDMLCIVPNPVSHRIPVGSAARIPERAMTGPAGIEVADLTRWTQNGA